MTPKSANLPQLEIRQHHVDVTIEDGYAVTSVEQVFFNPNNSELEAIYSFPVPEKASVGEFTYWINGKPVTGEVLEKQKAREVYKRVFDLVMRFRTSKSPKRTRSSTTYKCPGRPGH
ncbi:MAG: VIT domain-containing protein [Candidatus Thiodiazotropha sp. L084R]